MHKSVFLAVALSALVHSLPTSSSSLHRRQSQESTVPQFVLDYAPLVWLDTEEQFFPSDIAAQIANTYPTIDQTPIPDPPSPVNLANLDSLNAYGDGGVNVYLHSDEGINVYPTTPWLAGVVPASDGSTPNAIASTIVIVAKSNNITDVFYFSFYAFNRGNFVFENPSLELGDHVGDWEHTVVRFDTSTSTPNPTLMFFSQHSNGQAFNFPAVEKDASGLRPVVYSARGTHANYAIAGPHDHTLPDGLNGLVGPLIDHTSHGTLWDPALNTFVYSYTPATDTFTPLTPDSSEAGTGWLYYKGRWGDPRVPDGEDGQRDFFGFKKYDNGPTGPRDKSLGRTNVCADGQKCVIRPFLVPREAK
jgi:Vacuolar protein sorting-associated protein 62